MNINFFNCILEEMEFLRMELFLGTFYGKFDTFFDVLSFFFPDDF